MIKLIGFLRGINVGGRHKVPIATLRQKLQTLGCENVKTLLNTGNFVFETKERSIDDFSKTLESHLSQFFGFPVPVILRTH